MKLMFKQAWTVGLCFLGIFISACSKPTNPNVQYSGEDPIETMTVDKPVAKEKLTNAQDYYVPIYSDIYVDEQNPKSMLAATLSVRNTSQKEVIYVSAIDYYNTQGKLVKQFLSQPLEVAPLATFNYIVEKEDDTGGAGASFLVKTNASQRMQPVIEAVMVGHYSNKAFAFSVEGVPLLVQ